MKVFDNSWRTFAVRGLVLCAAVFGTVRLAVARDGVAGGPTRSFVTVAGTLTGVTATPPPTATFHFRRATAPTTELCTPPPRVTITNLDVTTHAFSVPVPIENCPGVFDGSDVTVSVDINDTLNVVNAATINPVPYAHFASVAGQYGTPDCPVGYERATDVAFTPDMRLCQRKRADGTVYDEVVRVGTGASAFWIDRFEASVFSNPDGSGVQFGSIASDHA